MIGKFVKNLFLTKNTLKDSKYDSAFTVLEVITAIFILTVGVGASLSLMYQALSAASVVEQKLTAAYLAQEGIEIVRNIRDANWLEGNLWDEGLCDLPPCEWQADYTTTDFIGDVTVCGDPQHYNCHAFSDSNFLNLDSEGFYSYKISDNKTKFNRKISISDKADLNGDLQPDIMTVLVEVKWKERGRSHDFKAIERITDWR